MAYELYKENYKSLFKYITENIKHGKHMIPIFCL